MLVMASKHRPVTVKNPRKARLLHTVNNNKVKEVSTAKRNLHLSNLLLSMAKKKRVQGHALALDWPEPEHQEKLLKRMEHAHLTANSRDPVLALSPRSPSKAKRSLACQPNNLVALTMPTPDLLKILTTIW